MSERIKNINVIKRIIAVVLAAFMMLSLMTAFVFDSGFVAFADDSEDASGDSTEGSDDTSETEEDETVDTPSVSGEAGIVMSASTSEVIYSYHSDRKVAMGDVTKLMTALVVIDSMYNDKEYSNKMQITDDMAELGDMFESGENVQIEDLLYALLMCNSDEAALALAIYTSGSESDFVDAMNSMAQQLGLDDTNYTNCTGEYNVKHYSTVSDTADLLQEALRYPVIKEILSTDTYTMSETNLSEEYEITRSDNVSTEYDTIAGSSGTMTEPSKTATYYGMAQDEDGMQIIVVLLQEKKKKEASEAIQMYKYGFYAVQRNVVIDAGERADTVKIKYGAKTYLGAYTETAGYVYIPPEGSESLVATDVYIYDDLEAPVEAGTKVGEYRIYVAGELTGTVDLVLATDVEEGWILSRFYISNAMTIILGVLLVIIILLLVRRRNIRARRKRAKERARQEKIRQIALQQKAVEDDRKRRGWTYAPPDDEFRDLYKREIDKHSGNSSNNRTR